MSYFPASLETLIDKFAALPGIGRKSAQRLAFHVLSGSDEEADSFADAIKNAKENIHFCKVCQNLTEDEICPICSSTRRDDLLLTPDELESINIIRRAFNGGKSEESVNQVLDLFSKTRNNGEFVSIVKKQKWFY